MAEIDKKLEKTLNSIDAPTNVEENNDGTYIIDLKDSDEFAKMYSRLDKNNNFEEDEDSTVMSLDNGSIQFVGSDYIITLLSNDNAGEYKMTVKKLL